MKELHPTMMEAEALAVELLHPSILSPVAREAAERALSDDGLSTASSSAEFSGNGSGNGRLSGSESGSRGSTVQSSGRSPGHGGVTISDDGSEEELFHFEKAWLKEVALRGGAGGELTPPLSPCVAAVVAVAGGDGGGGGGGASRDHHPAAVC